MEERAFVKARGLYEAGREHQARDAFEAFASHPRFGAKARACLVQIERASHEATAACPAVNRRAPHGARNVASYENRSSRRTCAAGYLRYSVVVTAPGQMLTDNLQLEEQIGAGGMGEVWVARHRALGSQVAVKLLSQIDEPELRTRFHQEARGVAQLSSPYVVQVFDVGITPAGQPFIVMELLRGQSLHERIEAGPELSLHDCAEIVTQLCRGLAHAHERGIVHRDIKPANLFLADAGGGIHLKVLDFGVAKYGGAADLGMTATGMMMGTPYYMSPEQIVDPKSVDFRADLWAAAVVMYACLTRTVPFVGETVGALSIAIHSGDYAQPSLHRSDLPPAIEAWFARAFNRDLGQRFASAAELAEAFVATVGGTPSSLVPSVPLSTPLDTFAHRPTMEASASQTPLPAQLTTQGGASMASSMATTPKGVPAWVAALLGAVALAAVAGLGFVVLSRSEDGERTTGGRETHEDDDGSEAQTKKKKKKKKKSGKKMPDKSSSKPTKTKPKVSKGSFDFAKDYAEVLAAAHTQRKQVDLVFAALTGMTPDGMLLDDDATFIAVFRARGTEVCVNVTLVDGDFFPTESACDKHARTPMRAPRCSQGTIAKKAAATLPKRQMTVSILPGTGGAPTWNVIAHDSDLVAVIADDC